MGNSMEVPQKIKNKATIWSSNFIRVFIWRKQNTNLKIYMHFMFTAILLTIAKTREQPKGSPMDEWIFKMGDKQTIMLSEISQTNTTWSHSHVELFLMNL